MENKPAKCTRPRFDPSAGVWVLTRYEDVSAALHSADLHVDAEDVETDAGSSARQQARSETLAAFAPAQVRLWSQQTAALASDRAGLLACNAPVDLLNAYLQPVCLSLSTIVTGLALERAEEVRELSLPVSRSAAEPQDAALRAEAEAVTAALESCFHSPVAMLRDPTFVALAYTLPALVANMIAALLDSPPQWKLLHEHPERIEQAVEELMRHPGLTRLTRRRACRDTVCNGVSLQAGDLVELHLMCANHDPARFPEPDEVNLARRDGGHFTLGAGAHACLAAGLVRAAATELLRPLLALFKGASLTRAVVWQGGSGFRSPDELHVLLSAASRQPFPERDRGGNGEGQQADADDGYRKPEPAEPVPCGERL